MKDSLQEAIQKVQSERRERHLARRSVAMLLALSILLSLCVSWGLHREGIALEGEPKYYCGKEENTHTDDCYMRGTELICGYEEGELVPMSEEESAAADEAASEEEAKADAEAEEEIAALEAELDAIPVVEPVYHVHTADCYEWEDVLVCGYDSDHVHDELCYDQETGELTCSLHEHDDDCYQEQYVLTCGYEEGDVENADEVEAYENEVAEKEQAIEEIRKSREEAKNAAADEEEQLVPHHHTEDCYAKELICGKEEHEHTEACLIDPNAEIDAEYEDKTPERTTVDWPADMVTVAQSQLGYTESKTDMDEYGNGYTMYAAQYYEDKPVVYADWDSTFVAYCLYHAGVPTTAVPQYASISALRSALAMMDSPYYTDDAAMYPYILPGDIVMYKNSEGDETIGIVSVIETDADELTTGLTVISGNVTTGYDTETDTSIDQVAEVPVALSDVTSTISINRAYGLGVLDDADQAVEEEKTKLDSYIGSITVSKKDENGEFEPLKEGDTVLVGEEIQLSMDFKLPEGGLKGKREMTYQLPNGIKLNKQETGAIYLPNSSTEIGTYTIDTNGLIKLHFNDKDETFDPDTAFTGDFYFRAKAEASGSGDDSKITFPGSNTEITLKKTSDLTAAKEITSDEIVDGQHVLTFKATFSTVNGTYDSVNITDQIGPWNGGKKGEFDKDSIKVTKVAADGQKEDYTNKAMGGIAYGTENDRQNFTISGLPELEAGTSYEVTYKIKVEKLDATGGGYFYNNIKGTYDDNKSTNDAYAEKKWNTVVSKEGKFDEQSGKVNWTITVKKPTDAESLKGYRVEDTLQMGTIDGDVTIYGQDGKVFKTLQNTNGQKTFSYEFDENATDETYVIKYSSKVPTGTESVKNDAKIITPGNGPTYSDSKEVTTGGRTDSTLTKSAANYNDPIRGGEYVDWKLTQKIPSRWESFTITDRITARESDQWGNIDWEPKNEVVKPEAHFAYAAELQEDFESTVHGMKFVTVSGKKLTYQEAKNAGIQITISYFESDDCTGTPVEPTDSTKKIYSFKIEFKKGSYSGEPLDRMEVGRYSTRVDMKKLPKGKPYHFVNYANDSSAFAPYNGSSSEPSITKMSSATKGQNYQQSGTTITYKDDGTDTLIYYRVFLNTKYLSDAEKDDHVTITDVLPEGLEFYESDRVDVYFEYSNRRNTPCEWGPGSWGSGWSGKYSGGHVEYEYDKNTNTLTMTIKDLQKGDWEDKKADTKATIEGFYFDFTAKVTDKAWEENGGSHQAKYTNKAKWGDKAEGENTTTVKRENVVLTKKGEQLTDRNGKPTKRVKYTLEINQNAEDLVPGQNTITLTDVLTSSSNKPVKLELDSVKLYQVDANGVKTLKSKDEFHFQNEALGNKQYQLKLTIPDDEHLILEYVYQVEGETPKLQNSAQLEGYTAKSNGFVMQSVTSGATAGNNSITIYKVDGDNETIKLGGAQFALTEFVNGSWDEANARTLTTSYSDGSFRLTTASSGNVIKQDTLYRLRETNAPTGYKLDSTPFYFIFMSSKDQDKAWNAAISGGAPTDVTQNAVTFYAYGMSYNKQFTNRHDMSIKKIWVDANGNEITTGTPVDSVSVELWKYNVSSGKNSGTKVTDISLSRDNNWTWTYTNAETNGFAIEDGYRYYIKESVPDDAKYKLLKYSLSNNEGITGDGQLTVTNQIPNQKSERLTIQKLWRDADGGSYNVEADGIISITLKLKGTPKDPSGSLKNTEQVIVLKAADGWKTTLLNLPEGYVYTVQEVSVPGFEPEILYDGDENKSNVENNGSITITNTYSGPSYELPATGAPGGTIPYTAGGAGLALAALMCGYALKRKREGRGE